MDSLTRGDKVIILDKLFHPTKTKGTVVGFTRTERINVLITSGLLEGKIKSYTHFYLRKET